MTLNNNETRVKTLDDPALIKIARTGNNEAIGEFIRRYRSNAMNWVQMLARVVFKN